MGTVGTRCRLPSGACCTAVRFRLAPIRGADLAEVGAFLHAAPQPTAERSASGPTRSCPRGRSSSPNHGFLLRDAGPVVGRPAGLLLRARGRRRPSSDFCNLGAWCVLESYRSQGVRLLRAAAGPARLPLHRPLARAATSSRSTSGWASSTLDTDDRAGPAPARRPGPRRRGWSTDPDAIERLLDGARPADLPRPPPTPPRPSTCVLVPRATEHCYVIVPARPPQGAAGLRLAAARGQPRACCAARSPALGRHLLLHHGVLVHAGRAAARRPPTAAGRAAGRAAAQDVPQRAGHVPAGPIDYLYSELDAAWPGEHGSTDDGTRAPPPARRAGRLRRPDRPALTFRDTTSTTRTLAGRRARAGRRACRALGARPRRPGGDLPRQADRDGRGHLRRLRGRRRSSSRSTRSSSRPRWPHPGRLRRPGPRHHRAAVGAAAARARRLPALEHVVLVGTARSPGPASAAPSRVARLRRPGGGPTRAPPRRSGRRPRHGRDPLHLRQHRPPKGVVLSHRNLIVGRRERQQLPRQHRRRRDPRRAAAQLRRRASASSPRRSPSAPTSCSSTTCCPPTWSRLCARHGVTGLTCVPPLWIQLAAVDVARRGAGAAALLRQHRRPDARDAPWTGCARSSPQAQPFLMYGLTEAFRSTYLDPAEVDRRPDSIGKAIPNAEILVVRPDGALADPGEEGELVHRGPLVALGYWNDPERTAQRFRPLPGAAAGLAAARARGVVRRHRGRRRGGLPLLRRPRRRHDQDVRLPGQPDRDRGGRLRHRPGRRRRRARGRGRRARASGSSWSSTAAGDGPLDTAALLAELRRDAAAVHGARRGAGAGRAARAHPTASSTACCCARRCRDGTTRSTSSAFGTDGGELLVGGIPLVAADRARRLHAVLRLRPRRDHPAGRRAARGARAPASTSGYAVKANPMPARRPAPRRPRRRPRRRVGRRDGGRAGHRHARRTGSASPAPARPTTSCAARSRPACSVELESEGEARRIAAVGEALGLRPRVAVRVNPDFAVKGSGMRMGGGPQQFGVDAEQAPACSSCVGEPRPRPRRASTSSPARRTCAPTSSSRRSARRSSCCSAWPTRSRRAVDLPQPRRRLRHPVLRPRTQPLDLDAVGENLRVLWPSDVILPAQPDARVVVELGRYLVGEAGVYVTRVVDRKVSRGRTYLVVDGGMHHQLAASGNLGQVIRRNYPIAVGNRADAARVTGRSPSSAACARRSTCWATTSTCPLPSRGRPRRACSRPAPTATRPAR